jgi:hypothetical protein
MHISASFIKRPVGTMLLTIAVLLAGTIAYRFLPVVFVSFRPNGSRFSDKSSTWPLHGRESDLLRLGRQLPSSSLRNSCDRDSQAGDSNG